MALSFPAHFTTTSPDAGTRLDQFLVTQLDLSRARVQQLISQEKVLVNNAPAKPALKLRGGESIRVLGPAEQPALHAIAEEIPLHVLYEDGDLAIINKAAGMMVHAGAGATEDQRNRGTLVNALLHHFASLSAVGGEMRPGIVHRLDKETSGLLVVAKNDDAHRKLAAQFARREVKKTYVALVQGEVKKDSATISASISRDRVRRVRMTTRQAGGREAVSHYRVVRRIDSAYGKFTLVQVKIDTGRTHQIRVHMASIGHPVVGDKLYGAPAAWRAVSQAPPSKSPPLAKEAGPGAPGMQEICLARNFLHSAELVLVHPRTGETLSLASPLPAELQAFLGVIGGDVASDLSTRGF